MQQLLVFGLWLRVTRQHRFTPIGGRQVHIHQQGSEVPSTADQRMCATEWMGYRPALPDTVLPLLDGYADIAKKVG